MAATVPAQVGQTGVGEVARLGPALAVVAHPDDESFGLGAVLAALVADGTDVRLLAGPGTFDTHVDRRGHRVAIACHQSQPFDNPVLARAADGERLRLGRAKETSTGTPL